MRRKSVDYVVMAEDAGEKFKDIIFTKMNVSSRLIRKCDKKTQILCNGQPVSMKYRVKETDRLSIVLPIEHNQFEPQKMDIECLYEDEDILVVNKPPFMVVHPTKGVKSGTLANGISHYFNKQNYDMKIRFINRIDRDTSGIVLVAKNSYAQSVLLEQMQLNKVDKRYYALVDGVVANDRGTIDAPIGKKNDGDIHREVFEGAKKSISHYKVIKRFDNATLLEVKIETGRTHQIRVHLQYIGHPIMGDELYGGSTDKIKRQALHCIKMSFNLPKDNSHVDISCDLPEDIKMCYNDLEPGTQVAW